MIVMMGLVICCVVMPGCIDSIPKNLAEKPARVLPEPETGIAAWIVAVNDRDFGAVYNLMPASKRTGITQEQYIQLNRENPSPFLASGLVVTDFMILKKHVEGRNATITAGLQTIRYSSDINATPVHETVFFTFEETFEDYEWKVWTRK
jgi:hypothetical protein